jgi:hypothetical protein
MTPKLVELLCLFHRTNYNSKMAPAQKNANANGSTDEKDVQISGAEANLLDAIFKRCTLASKPNLSIAEWEAAAEQAGYKDMKSTKERYRQVCKKLGWFEGENNDTPKKPSASKRKAPAGGDGMNGAEAQTPSKKPKKGKATTKKPVPDIKDEDEVLEDEFQVKLEDEVEGEAEGDGLSADGIM